MNELNTPGHRFTSEEEKENTTAFLRGIPKVDVHCHSTGLVNPEEVFNMLYCEEEKAAIYKDQRFTSEDEMKKYLRSTRSLGEYLEHYDVLKAPMDRIGDIARIIQQGRMHFRRRHNVILLELRFALKSLDPNYDSLLSVEQEMGQYVQAVNDLKGQGIELPLTLCIRRHGRGDSDLYVKSAYENLAVAQEYRDYIGSLDLAGAEKEGDTTPFIDTFQKAKADGFAITVHAGEACHQSSIEDAINHLHADRIGHGTSLNPYSSLADLIIEREIPLEVCITSNTRTFAQAWDKKVGSHLDHPIRDFVDRGVKVILGTDGPTTVGTNAKRELYRFHEAGFSVHEIIDMIKDSIHFSFASEATKQDCNKQFEDYMKEHQAFLDSITT